MNSPESLGEGPHTDFNIFSEKVGRRRAKNVKLPAKRLKLVQNALAERDENAKPVIKRVHKPARRS